MEMLVGDNQFRDWFGRGDVNFSWRIFIFFGAFYSEEDVQKFIVFVLSSFCLNQEPVFESADFFK